MSPNKRFFNTILVMLWMMGGYLIWNVPLGSILSPLGPCSSLFPLSGENASRETSSSKKDCGGKKKARIANGVIQMAATGLSAIS